MAFNNYSRKKYKSKAYSGYVKFPLDGIDTKEDFKLTCEYYGDFVNPKKRQQIFKRPRKFRVEMWVKVSDGYNVSEVAVTDDKINLDQLAEIIYQCGMESIDEVTDDELVYMSECYFKVVII